jgi:hypothetical protein
MFDDASPLDRLLHSTLQDGFVNVVTPYLASLVVLPPVLLRENPLPAPLGGSVGIFTVQRARHLHPPPSFRQVFLMDRLDLS